MLSLISGLHSFWLSQLFCCMHRPYFACPSPGWWLCGLFPHFGPLWIIPHGMHTSLSVDAIFISLEKKPRRGIARLYRHCLHNILKNYIPVFLKKFHLFMFPQQCLGVPTAPILTRMASQSSVSNGISWFWFLFPEWLMVGASFLSHSLVITEPNWG
jgi:hypothetical protein